MKVKRLPPDTLCHYGIKGQRWGVITKEYESVGTRSSGTSDPRKKNKNTTGYSKGVKRRGEGMGNTTPVGRQDKYIGRNSRFTEDYMNYARKQKYSQLSKCSSLDFQVDPSLKDNQISCKKTMDADGFEQYSFTFKDEDTYNRWRSSMGLDDDSLVERYNTWKEESDANTAYTNLEEWTAQTVNANMMMLDKYGTVTMKTGELDNRPFANFEEMNGSVNQTFPGMDFYDMTDEEGNTKPQWQRKKKGYLSENNQRDKESGKMEEAEAKADRRKYYMREAAKSAQRAEQTKAYNKKLTTKAKRLGQSFKEVYSEGYNKAKGLLKRKKNLKHSDIYSNVKRLPSDTLCHRGIKGQKHGIRRYQYANGTYTREGNERYRPRSNKRKLTKENAEKSLYAGATAAAIIAIAKMAMPTVAASSNVSLGAMAAASVLSSPAAAFTIPAATIAGGFVVLDAILEDLKKEK